MKTIEEVAAYLSEHNIVSRYDRKNIRQYLMNKFPEDREGICFSIFMRKDKNEITYQDFKKYVEDEDNNG